MAIQFKARRMSGGAKHEHIAGLWWTDPADGTTKYSVRAVLVTWIEDKKGQAYTDDGRGNRAQVFVRTSAQGVKFLQTHADGIWTDNLLALPER